MLKDYINFKICTGLVHGNSLLKAFLVILIISFICLHVVHENLNNMSFNGTHQILNSQLLINQTVVKELVKKSSIDRASSCQIAVENTWSIGQTSLAFLNLDFDFWHSCKVMEFVSSKTYKNYLSLLFSLEKKKGTDFIWCSLLNNTSYKSFPWLKNQSIDNLFWYTCNENI